MHKLNLSFSVMVGTAATATLLAAMPAQAQMPGEYPNLRPRITQEMVRSELSHRQVRAEGRRIFSTPFNPLDGLGDGPMNSTEPVSPGGRPTLGANGMFLRMNGLDSQTCLECHGVLSTRTIPARFAVGGAGNVSDSAFPGVVDPDVDDSENNGFAAMQGRMINPPFSFGSGGVELLGKEMTRDLQALAAQFGRKGCCATVREFDIGAMQFHHGIQPVEIVGEDVDDDGDGVANELLVGELSALHVFQTSLEPPQRRGVAPA